MLQRAFFLLHERLDLPRLFRLTEPQWIAELQRAAADSPAEHSPAAELLDGLFGPARRLYKRLAQFSFFEQPDIHRRIARQPYPWLAPAPNNSRSWRPNRLGQPIAPHEILFDAPPVEREVEFNVEIHFSKEDRYRRFDAVSPVVRTLAKEQFDDYVKQVRLFAHPRIADPIKRLNRYPRTCAGRDRAHARMTE